MVKANFNLNDIIKVLEPENSHIVDPHLTNIKFGTDSRKLNKDQWFIALSGSSFDGHEFIPHVIEQGCTGIIIDNPQYFKDNTINCLLVKNTLDAYHRLARHWLNQVRPVVIAITGSSGKTTTKEICSQLLVNISADTHKSANNENNEYGVPKTIFNMDSNCKYLVVELAMRGLKQIEYLAKTVTPQYGIITNAGIAHIELLGSKENIIKAKCELLEIMNQSSIARLAVIGSHNPTLTEYATEVYHKPLKVFADNSVNVIESNAKYTKFLVDNIEYEMQSFGQAVLQDAWCVIQVLLDLGIDRTLIQQYLKLYSPLSGRGNKIINKAGTIIIDESYNANPDSVKAAISSLLDKNVYNQSKKIVVLGQMAELGDEAKALHEEVGCFLNESSITHVLTVGALAKYISDTISSKHIYRENLANWENVREYLRSVCDDDTIVLIKGSRVAGLDKLVDALT